MKEKIAKAKKYINAVDKLRVILLCVAVLMLLFVYFGEKLWGGLAWFSSSVEHIYIVLSYMVLGIVLTTFAKYAMIAYHNALVKKL